MFQRISVGKLYQKKNEYTMETYLKVTFNWKIFILDHTELTNNLL